MARKKKETEKSGIGKEEVLIQTIKELAPKDPEVTETVQEAYLSPSEYKALKPGDWISLNIRNTACFGIEQNGAMVIWLSRKNRSMQLPNGLTEKTMKDLYSGILNGDIVKGNVYISKEDQNPNIIEEYKKLLNSSGIDLPEQIKKALKDTIRKQKINGITSVEIMSKLYDHENNNRKRQKVLEFLEMIIEFGSKFHNVHYEAHQIGESTKVVLNKEDLSVLEQESKKEVIEKTGLSIKRARPSVGDFAQLYKSI